MIAPRNRIACSDIPFLCLFLFYCGKCLILAVTGLCCETGPGVDTAAHADSASRHPDSYRRGDCLIGRAISGQLFWFYVSQSCIVTLGRPWPWPCFFKQGIFWWNWCCFVWVCLWNNRYAGLFSFYWIPKLHFWQLTDFTLTSCVS